MDRCKTIKVKPWGADQGEFVEIDADSFDPAIHTLLGEDPKPARKKKAAD